MICLLKLDIVNYVKNNKLRQLSANHHFINFLSK